LIQKDLDSAAPSVVLDGIGEQVVDNTYDLAPIGNKGAGRELQFDVKLLLGEVIAEIGDAFLHYLPDLKRFSSIDLGFSWPFDLMFYIGLLLMIIGYYLRG